MINTYTTTSSKMTDCYYRPIYIAGIMFEIRCIVSYAKRLHVSGVV